MSELTLTVMRLGFLAVLWLFVIVAVQVIRSDLFGTRVTQRGSRREANRPQGPGAGKHRGDRRDMNKLYTNNARHPSRGSNPRPDVSTRKR